MNSCERIARADRFQRGVTLVEILVTVLVMSVGLLGIAGLQAISLRDTTSSVVRSQATAMADYIIDRMRANRMDAASYQIAMGATSSATTRAGLDLADWKALLATNRSDGSVAVAGNIVTVTIAWGERETVRGADVPADPIAQLTFVTRTEL